MKFMSFLQAREGDLEGMREWFFESHVPDVLDAAPRLRRWQVRLAVEPPRAAQVEGRRAPEADLPQFDLLSETWFDSRDDFLHRFGADQERIDREVAAAVGRVAHYRVVEHEAWDHRGGVCPTAIHSVGLVRWRQDVPEKEIRRHWEEHEWNARRVHYGCVAYRRNWVEEALGDSPALSGVADLSFLTEADLERRHFSSARGTEEILTDLGDFVESFRRHFFGEHIYIVGAGRG